MTQKFSTKDLKKGDTVYYEKPVKNGFSYLGIKYIKSKVARITPKGTKMVLENGAEFNQYNVFYKELDQTMMDENDKTIAREKIYDNMYELEKLRKEGKLRTLDLGETRAIADLLETAVHLSTSAG